MFFMMRKEVQLRNIYVKSCREGAEEREKKVTVFVLFHLFSFVVMTFCWVFREFAITMLDFFSRLQVTCCHCMCNKMEFCNCILFPRILNLGKVERNFHLFFHSRGVIVEEREGTTKTQ